MNAQCPAGTWSLNVTINPDQYPEETSWYVMDFFGDTLMQGGPYTGIIDYQPQYASACAPIDSFYFVINDTYGDGVAGSLWGGNDGSVYIEQCGDTIWELPMADFGNFMYDTIYTSGCPPPPPVFGCMDSSYVEFNLAATLDTGMCITPKIFGCTDSLAYNYLDSANTDIDIDSCMHELELTDLAGNGWAGSSLKLQQATSLLPPFNYQDIGTYTLVDGFDTTFFINLIAGYPVRAIFEITQQSDFTAVQCGYKLYYEDYTAIDIAGGFVNPIPPFFPITGNPYCGNNCIEKIYGCIDTLAINYDSIANTDDSTCYYNPGCMNPLYLEYDTLADYNDGSCATLIVLGCMDSTALNYNPNANVELAGSCIAVVEGCTNPLAFNYNPNANIDDGGCISFIYGCTDPSAFNYDSLANTDNGTCIPVVFGCTDTTMFNYNPLANTDNGSCIAYLYGCTDPLALNYNASANTLDNSCCYIGGCTDSTATNFNPDACYDDNSCIAIIEGCTDFYAYNYNIQANTEDGSCVYDAECITGPGNPYWLNDQCYAWVIQVDRYCCDTDWDNVCQLTYDYCYTGWTGNLPPARLEGEQILVYPNPAQDKIYVNEKVNLEMFNVLGDIIVSGKDINVLDISKINPGMYILRITYNKQTYIRNIIKK